MTPKLDSLRLNHVMLTAVINYNHCSSSNTASGNYFFQPVFLKILLKNIPLYIQRRMDLCSTVELLNNQLNSGRRKYSLKCTFALKTKF